jgi:hypothetical protein
MDYAFIRWLVAVYRPLCGRAAVVHPTLDSSGAGAQRDGIMR